MYACSDHEAEMGLQILREHEHESVNYKRERERVERGHANRA